MPTRQGGSDAKKVSISRRRNCLRRTTVPCSSTPWAWKTFFARRPILVTDMEFSCDEDAEHHTRRLYGSGGRPPHFDFAGAWTVYEQNRLLLLCFSLPEINKA